MCCQFKSDSRHMNTCKLCGKDLTTTRRKRCGTCSTKIRRYRAKTAAVKLLGGKCINCGWTGNIAGFVFHHVDENKLFNIKHAADKRWIVVKEELKKCVLLCGTCHLIKHSNLENVSQSFLDEVVNYRGNLYG